jgi:hypothetical protein
MTKIVEIIKEVVVTIEDDQLDKMLKDYQESIYEDATIEDVFKQIGWSIGTSCSSFVEGCGEDRKDFIIESNETIDVTIEDYKEEDIIK